MAENELDSQSCFGPNANRPNYLGEEQK